MKRLFLSAIFVLLSFGSAFAQAEKSFSYTAFISLGYANIASNDLSYCFDRLVEYYRDADAPIKVQEGSGRTITVGSGMLCSTVEDPGVGVFFGHLHSPALSYYADPTGILKTEGSCNSYEVVLVVQYAPFRISVLHMIFDSQVGACHTSLRVEQETRVVGHPEFDYNWKNVERRMGSGHSGRDRHIHFGRGIERTAQKNKQYDGNSSGRSRMHVVGWNEFINT